VNELIRKHGSRALWALFGLVGCTALIAIALAVLVDLRFASVVWLVLTAYLLPFAVFVGTPSYSLARAVRAPPVVAGFLAVTAFGFAAYATFPLAVQCDTSIAGRKKLLGQLSAAEAATLQTPATLTGPNWPCPTFFVYHSSEGYVSVDAVADFIHGVKLFREVVPR
jgi:hypothetical protein